MSYVDEYEWFLGGGVRFPATTAFGVLASRIGTTEPTAASWPSAALCSSSERPLKRKRPPCGSLVLRRVIAGSLLQRELPSSSATVSKPPFLSGESPSGVYAPSLFAGQTWPTFLASMIPFALSRLVLPLSASAWSSFFVYVAGASSRILLTQAPATSPVVRGLTFGAFGSPVGGSGAFFGREVSAGFGGVVLRDGVLLGAGARAGHVALLGSWGGPAETS